MQIDLDTGEILEDGSDEELAEWVQLYRATRDTLDALRTPRRDLPLLGAGDTPQAGRPAGGAPRHSGAPHGVHPRCVARQPPAGHERRPHETYHCWFTHVHRLPDTCARCWRRIATASRRSSRVVRRALTHSGSVGPGANRSLGRASRPTGSASARSQACGAITRWPRLATSSSRSVTAKRQTPRT